jgi:hypothetical protein
MTGEGRNSVWLAAQRGVRVRYDVASVYDWQWPEAAFNLVARKPV